MNFESFRDARIVIVNKTNGSIISGAVDASQPVNGNDESQADMVNGKIISCGAQFDGISDIEILKDYYCAFGIDGKRTLFEGEWELDFDLEYVDTTREYTISKNIKIGELDRSLEKIMISPLSIQLQLQPLSDGKYNNEDHINLLKMINSNINLLKIIMKNKTELLVHNLSFDGDTIYAVFPAVLDLDMILAIDFNGVRIEIIK
jgi:hypothetical protein